NIWYSNLVVNPYLTLSKVDSIIYGRALSCPFFGSMAQGKLARLAGGEGRVLGARRFVVELIKPSHYDDDGYVIQWWKSWIPSNSLACLYGIATDLADRHSLGSDVAIEIRAYDECHTVIP